jgi:hypothetical protein
MKPEIHLPEPRGLAVGVNPSAADGRRDGVHLADVAVIPLVLARPEGLRLDQRVRA